MENGFGTREQLDSIYLFKINLKQTKHYQPKVHVIARFDRI